MELEPVIGLEVHAQLSTETKIFCGCTTRFGAPPNENTCPVCLGLPGALPVLNAKAVELALRAALALQCKIPGSSIFARKNYFYPDLPKGYQISQYEQPLAVDGQLKIEIKDSQKIVRIKRIHMEEDAGKLVHEGVEIDANASFVDYNRSGVPLIEIVTEPDLRSPEEAYSYLKELKTILQFCEVSSANMEEGKLRCDANISLRPIDSPDYGTKVEIKNLNSFKNVQKALGFEIERQRKAILSHQRIIQETRLFDADKGITEAMRSKEEAHDYRYFPEPDLLPLQISEELLKKTEASLPELPEAKRERFQRDYQLGPMEASILTEEKALSDFFEETARLSGEPKQSSNWILRDLLEKIKTEEGGIAKSSIRPRQIAELIGLIKEKTISNTQAKDVFQEMWVSAKNPVDIVRERGMKQISDSETVSKYVEEVVAQNADVVSRYKNGETKLLGVLVGQVMKASAGKANPAIVNRLLKEKLS